MPPKPPSPAQRRYQKMMLPLRRRVSANLRFMQKPVLQYLPLFLGVVVIVVACGLAFYLLDDRQESFAGSVYVAYSLLFMENIAQFPEHWLLRILEYLLPILGLVVVLDGLVRFSYHILRRDEMGQEWVHAMAKTHKNHVVLFGLGRVGFRVLQQLIRLKEPVIVVEKDPHCPNLAFARNHGVPVLIGSGREDGLLEDVNLAQAKSLILATDDDLANLELAIDAQYVKPDIRLVLRMYDQELASKVKESFGIHVAFSTSELAAPLFATASFDPSIVNSFYAGDRLLVVAELDVIEGSKLQGQSVAAVGKDSQAFLVAFTRNGNAEFYPAAQRVLEAGDRITVQCEPESLKHLHELNRA